MIFYQKPSDWVVENYAEKLQTVLRHQTDTMATDTADTPSTSLSTLLETIRTSLSGAVASLPSSNPPHNEEGTLGEASILPPADGMSLLDTKSEILLSYLQNIVFLVLLHVRQLSASAQQGSTANGEDESQIQDEVARKLAELRIYLDRGVRPLEGRLKYQVDKVLKAAEDSQRRSHQQKQQSNGNPPKTHQTNSGNNAAGSEGDSGSEDSSSNDGEQEEQGEEDQEVDELAYRPNLAAFARGKEATKQGASASRRTGDGSAGGEDGIYRPPKIKPTALPPPESDRRADREARRIPKSRVMNEFVRDEMSSAPMAETSIGSTIRHGGRSMKTQRDRDEDEERKSYEETNFMRLPKESKKERKKKKGTTRSTTGFGGEDWRGLGEGADRIERLTRRGKQSGGSNALERSRKRRATEDGPRGDGFNVGERFEKRRKKVAGWKR